MAAQHDLYAAARPASVDCDACRCADDEQATSRHARQDFHGGEPAREVCDKPIIGADGLGLVLTDDEEVDVATALSSAVERTLSTRPLRNGPLFRRSPLKMAFG